MREPSIRSTSSSLGLLLAATSIAVGCTGEIHEDSRDGVNGHGQPVCATSEPWGPTVLRRLLRVEYRNVVRDLFAIEPPSANLLPDDATIGGFTTTAGQVLTAALVEKYVDAADAVATALRPGITRFFPCADDEAACVASFLGTEGERIFRRPLTEEEKDHYLAFFTAARSSESFEDSALLVIEAMLVAPQFLFHLEARSDGATSGPSYALTPHQLASRLSFALWRTLPDARLFERARNGSLVEPATFREEASRLMSDPRAEISARAFFEDWLMIDAIERLPLDPAVPELNEELIDMLAERPGVTSSMPSGSPRTRSPRSSSRTCASATARSLHITTMASRRMTRSPSSPRTSTNGASGFSRRPASSPPSPATPRPGSSTAVAFFASDSSAGSWFRPRRSSCLRCPAWSPG